MGNADGRTPLGMQGKRPTLRVAAESLLEPAELDGSTSTGAIYWKGAVTVSGSHPGEGFAELTGYATSLEDRF